MTYTKINDREFEVWPENEFDAVEKLGAAMVHAGIFFYLYHEPCPRHAYDTPVSLLNQALKRVMWQLKDDVEYAERNNQRVA